MMQSQGLQIKPEFFVEYYESFAGNTFKAVCNNIKQEDFEEYLTYVAKFTPATSKMQLDLTESFMELLSTVDITNYIEEV